MDKDFRLYGVDNKVVHYLFKGNRCNKLVTKEQVNKINKK